MKKIISLLFVAVLTISSMFVLASCGSSKIEKEFSYVKTYIEDRVIDPTSLIFNYAEGILDIAEERIYYKVNYNGKNSFGGYVGSKDYYYILDLTNHEVSTYSAERLYEIVETSYKLDDVDGEKNYYYEKIIFD